MLVFSAATAPVAGLAVSDRANKSEWSSFLLLSTRFRFLLDRMSPLTFPCIFLLGVHVDHDAALDLAFQYLAAQRWHLN